MFDWIKRKFSKGLWTSLAMIIVLVMAGPEIILSMELMALAEALGASTFVMVYLSGISLYFEKPIRTFVQFESKGHFFVPTFDVLKKMPSILVHMLPERTLVFVFLSCVVVCIPFLFYEVLFKYI